MNPQGHVTPLVSVVMPVFNGASFVRYSILSVVRQSFQSWELIVCDDGSEDRTCEIVNEFSVSDDRIRLISNTGPKGAAGARNSAIREARGKYVAFLDSDDLWFPDKLSVQVGVLETGVEFCFSSYLEFDSLSKRVKTLVVAEVAPDARSVVKGNPFGCSTVILLRELLDQEAFPSFDWSDDVLGRLIGGRLGHEDYCAWLAVFSRRPSLKCVGVESALVFYRVSAASLSGSKFKSSVKYWLVYRRFLRLSFFRSARCLFAAWIRRGGRRKAVSCDGELAALEELLR